MTCRYLTYKDRKNMETLYKANMSLIDIANGLGVHIATIYRELTRGSTGRLDKNGRNGYSAELAQKHVRENLKRRGRHK